MFEGQKKINIILLMAFLKKFDLPDLINLGHSQNVLYNIMRLNEREWSDLLKYVPILLLNWRPL